MRTLKTKLNKVLFLILVAMLTYSCSETFPNNEKFVIESVVVYSNGLYFYKLKPTQGRGRLYLKVKHLYQAGDTLTLKPSTH